MIAQRFDDLSHKWVHGSWTLEYEWAGELEDVRWEGRQSSCEHCLACCACRCGCCGKPCKRQDSILAGAERSHYTVECSCCFRWRKLHPKELLEGKHTRFPCILRAGSKSPHLVTAVCIHFAFLPPSHSSLFAFPLLYRFQPPPRCHLTSNPIPHQNHRNHRNGVPCVAAVPCISSQQWQPATSSYLIPVSPILSLDILLFVASHPLVMQIQWTC